MSPISGRIASMARLAAALGLTLVGTTAAHAETVNCTDVATLAAAPPYTISAQGVYCLHADLSYTSPTGSAITIDSNNVVLDLNAHKIGGGGASTTLAYGVFVNNHGGVIVKNGLVRGFRYGIYFNGGSANNVNLVDDIHAVANTSGAISLGSGVHNTVRNCVVAATGGSTAGGVTWGITNSGTSGFITNCTVSNTFVAAGGDTRYGIFVNDGRAVNNQVIGDGGGTGTDVCLGMNSGIYKDNIVSACTSSYTGGTAVGTTNFP